jgi:hypothetical protein
VRPGAKTVFDGNNQKSERSCDGNVTLTGYISGIGIVTRKQPVSMKGDCQTRSFTGTEPIGKRLGEIGFVGGEFDAGERSPCAFRNLALRHAHLVFCLDSRSRTDVLKGTIQNEVRAVDNGEVYQNRVV